jgi:DNA (cytosine-5)-methyltransferase 1
MKILNLYSSLGGNRFKWNEVKNDIKVTAVENDIEIAKLYQKRFPADNVIIADAHNYLLNNYKKYDFIWSSPPCPSHSKSRFARHNTTIPIYPDLKLYEEIIFLQNYFNGKFVVENVIPYYQPLIQAKKRGRHLFWTNFNLPNNLNERKCNIMESNNEVKKWCDFHEFNFYNYKGKQRIDKIARNLVDYEVGKTIFETALGIINNSKNKQIILNL